MLTHLSIQNFALIERTRLEFGPGLLVLTGATGAGKSILVSAIRLLLGERASPEVIRAEAEEAVVQGVIALRGPQRAQVQAQLEALGIPVEDELIVRRTIRREGKNRVFVNDTATSLRTLTELTAPLVDLIGQHQHLSLLQADVHRDMIDRFGQLEPQLEGMEAAYRRWSKADRELKALTAAAHGRAERTEFLRFQLQEIETLNPVEGELERLEQQLKRARNATRLSEAAQLAAKVTTGSSQAADTQIARASEALRKVVSADPTLNPWLERLDAIEIEIADLGRELQRYASGLELEDDLDALEGRHAQIRSMTKRMGIDFEGLFEKRTAIRQELETLENYADNLSALQAETDAAMTAAWGAAEALRDARAQVAGPLFDAIRDVLEGLAMRDTRFDLAQLRRDGLRPWGGFDLEIHFSANPGEPPRPLSKVASGGELSRLMLALKTVLTQVDPVSTYLFDEVDTGVGGAVATRIGELIASIADGRQVFCITHLPQIAAHADTHYRVEKHVVDGRTHSTLTPLAGDARTQEIARMLGDAELSETTLAHADEMLERARAR